MKKKPTFSLPDKFVVTYSLGKRHLGELELVQAFAKQQNGIEYIDIYDDKGKNKYAVGPLEFVWLIHHAKLVVSDSFHAIVFSILFGTPFIACERIDHVESMNSRIETLLDNFGLSEFTEKNIKNLSDIADIPDVSSILKTERELFYNFLNNCLLTE